MKNNNTTVFKIAALFLAICLLCCSCDFNAEEKQPEENKVLAVDSTKHIDGVAEFTVRWIGRTDFITTLNPTSQLSYYAVEKDNFEYLEVIADVTNLTKKGAAVRDLLDVKILIGETFYKTDCAPETEDGREFLPDEMIDIPSGHSSRVHYFVRLSSDLLKGNMTVCLEADGKAYTIPVMYKDLAVISPEKLDRNGSFKTGDCTVHIKSYDSAARIQPENAGKEYNYYEVSDEANILFIVNTEISNNSQKKVYVDDVMSLCITDGYDRYFATAVLENEDKTDYLVDQVTEILPRRTIQVSYVIDVPFSVVKEDLMLEIFSYGKRYRLFY